MPIVLQLHSQKHLQDVQLNLRKVFILQFSNGQFSCTALLLEGNLMQGSVGISNQLCYCRKCSEKPLSWYVCYETS